MGNLIQFFPLLFLLMRENPISIIYFQFSNCKIIKTLQKISAIDTLLKTLIMMDIHLVQNFGTLGNKPRPMTSLLIYGSQLVPLAANLWRMHADSAVIGILLRWREVICIQLLASKKVTCWSILYQFESTMLNCRL